MKEEYNWDILTTKKVRNKLMKLSKEELIKVIDMLVTIDKLACAILKDVGIDLK